MTGKKSPKDARTERLEAALKANLKRRKAQSRARKAVKTSAAPVSGHNSAGKPSD